jgi:hypothetical protein
MHKNLIPTGAKFENKQQKRLLLSIHDRKLGYMTNAVPSRDVTPRAVTGQLSNRSSLPTNASLASQYGAGTRYSSLVEFKQGSHLHPRNDDFTKNFMKYV